MQLDETRLAVRERGFPEILDLSLHMLRLYARPLFASLAIGVVPMMLLNHWLIGWMAGGEYVEYEFTFMPGRFVWTMSLLVFIEAPLASVVATAYLGHAVFQDQPSIRRLAIDTAKMLPRLLWCQIIVRGVAAAIVLLLGVSTYEEYSPFEALLIPLVLVVALLRAIRPYMNEIILLEKNPLRARNPLTMTIWRRTSLLHSPSTGDLFFRWCGAAIVSVLLVLAVSHTFLFFQGVLLNSWRWTPAMVTVFLPLSMWLVAGYMTVVRFLGYLDLRIRHEGWEVELRLRAEAAKLASKLV